MVSQPLDFEDREVFRPALGLLQAQDIRLGIFEVSEQMREPRLDRVDVPARDFHGPIGQPIEKEIPQPQDEAAFGLRIWKEAPIRSSTKSTSAPLSRPSETSSTTMPTPSRSNTKSSSLRWSSKERPY